MKKGRFIVFEGIDGSGSTTQANKLADHFTSVGVKCVITAQPSKNSVGLFIKKILQSKIKISLFKEKELALLFAADRLVHYSLNIKNNINAGINVICDRYVMSSLAYQGINLDIDWIRNINQYAPIPDITILIDVDDYIAKVRRENRHYSELFDDFNFQVMVRKSYLRLSKQFRCYIINGNGNRNNVFNLVLACLKGY